MKTPNPEKSEVFVMRISKEMKTKRYIGKLWKEHGFWKLQLSKHIETFTRKKDAVEFWLKSVEVKAPWIISTK